jgi:hypothetical protein
VTMVGLLLASSRFSELPHNGGDRGTSEGTAPIASSSGGLSAWTAGWLCAGLFGWGGGAGALLPHAVSARGATKIRTSHL